MDRSPSAHAPMSTNLGQLHALPHASEEDRRAARGPAVPVQSVSLERVFPGALFPSFDHEANYLAKQAELKTLGFDVEDADDTDKGALGAGALSRRSDAVASSPAVASSRDEVSILERQLRRRDEIYAVSQRRATEEAKQYAEMIGKLRAESRRKEALHADAHSSLSAQVEAMQYVIQRRNDADNETATVRFVDVETEVDSVSHEWDAEVAHRNASIQKFGEESIVFIEQLSREAVLQAKDSQNISHFRKELEEVRDIVLQQTKMRVAMLTDRIRTNALRSISTELRDEYTVRPGGGQPPAGVGKVLRAFVKDQAEAAAEFVQKEMLASLTHESDVAYDNGRSCISVAVQALLVEAQAAASRTVQAEIQWSAQSLAVERRVLAQHLSDERQRHDARREKEEASLRELVLEMGKLLETQRLSTNDLRMQLLLQAKIQQAAATGIKTSSKRRASATGGSRSTAAIDVADSKRSGHGKQASDRSAAQTKLTTSPTSTKKSPRPPSRRILFEPLTDDQVLRLYGSQTKQTVAVQEVPVEQLSKLTAHAMKTKREAHEQNQLIPLSSRQPASLLGRGSARKVPTKLTSAASGTPMLSTAVAAPRPSFLSSDEATLQELRRLRIRISPSATQ